jgi:hypothetical protein
LLGIKKGEEKPAVVPIQVNNQGAIALVKRDGWNGRTRHMNFRYQHVHQALRDRSIRMEYVASEEQLADGLTKALKTELFERWRGKLGKK